jgi:hypothetical protein
MVSWQDYEGVDGFGAGPGFTENDLSHLNKALTAGNDINNPGAAPGQGFLLRVESLERTLKNVTYRMEHIRLWKAIPKLAAFNTVEEHNEVSSYGEGLEGFIGESALPPEDDSTYARRYATVKFLGTTRSVSHVMSLIRPAHGNVIANETVSGTMWLLRIVERALFYARSDLSDIQFDGYEKLISDNAPAENIIDLRGQPLDEDVLIDAALTISDEPNYGIPTHLHLNPKVKADLVKTFFPKARYDLLEKTKQGMVGLDVKGFTSPAGDVTFEPNVFVNDGGAPKASPAGDAALRPPSPTISTGATTPVEAATLFGDDDAGSYFYSISAHNDQGRSAAIAVDAGAIVVASGDKVTFGVTPGAGGIVVKWYELFRTEKGGAVGKQRLIARIPNVSGAGEQIVDDLNEALPFTSSACMWQQNLEAMSWKQLAPFLKVPLATINTSIRWMQLVYGVPVLYAPGKTVLFKNVGRAPNFKGQP